MHLVPNELLPKHPKGFVIETVTMLGDADYYIKNYLKFDTSLTEDEFISIYEFLVEYRTDNTIKVWESIKDLEDYIYDIIASCPHSGEYGQLTKVGIFYYDELGRKYTSKLIN